MKGKQFLFGFLAGSCVILGALGYQVWKVDPYFHYHAPDTAAHSYTLNAERYQNDGIVKHFTYDAMITGSSMTSNFKASQMDELFGVRTVKTTFLGATPKETAMLIRAALKANPDLKMVLRSIDIDALLREPERMGAAPSATPSYLYDRNPFNDVNYLLRREVLFDRVLDNHGSGITDFDTYSNWQSYWTYGIHSVAPEGIHAEPTAQTNVFTPEERRYIRENLERHYLAPAQEYPDTEFYVFIAPYGLCWWAQEYSTGSVGLWTELQQIIAETLLPQENIRLFSFFNQFDMLEDQNNYKDITHYAGWINDWMLSAMSQGIGAVTWENLEENLAEQYAFYTTYDYNRLNNQTDYEEDLLAAQKWSPAEGEN